MLGKGGRRGVGGEVKRGDEGGRERKEGLRKEQKQREP